MPCENKLFWQLSQLDGVTINAVASPFLHERLKVPEAYSELSRTSKIELFAKILFPQKFHLRCLTGFKILLCILLPWKSLYTLREESFTGKKLRELRNEFYERLVKLRRTNYCFYQKKYLYNLLK